MTSIRRKLLKPSRNDQVSSMQLQLRHQSMKQPYSEAFSWAISLFVLFWLCLRLTRPDATVCLWAAAEVLLVPGFGHWVAWRGSKLGVVV